MMKKILQVVSVIALVLILMVVAIMYEETVNENKQINKICSTKELSSISEMIYQLGNHTKDNQKYCEWSLEKIYLEDGEFGYEGTKNALTEMASWAGGEIGKKVGDLIDFYSTTWIGGDTVPLWKAVGYVIGTEVAEYGAEYIFDCLFSAGIDGDLVLDAEFELFLYKIETGEMDNELEIIENFSDIFL